MKNPETENFKFKVNYRKLKKNENLYDDCPDSEQIVMAEYMKSEDNPGNIFIESLPRPRTSDDIEKDFSSLVYSYDRKRIEKMSVSERLINIGIIRDQFRVVLPFDEELDRAIYEAFIRSYRNRRLCIDARHILKYDNSDADRPCPSKLYRKHSGGGTYGSFNMLGYGGSRQEPGCQHCTFSLQTGRYPSA